MDDKVPLVVDLDGTLIKSDLLVESGFAHLGADLSQAFLLFSALRSGGKARLKAEIANAIEIDAAHLPYDARVIELIEQARAEDRPVFLASASNERYVRAVAEHLGLFDGWYGSTAIANLTSKSKTDLLVRAFGVKGFDYIGNDSADLPVWSAARNCIAITSSASVRRKLSVIDGDALVMDRRTGGMAAWMKLLRPHQWAKNALVFVPLLTAHLFNFWSILFSVAAFIAFSAAASSVYIINDLVDIEADRKHPSKKWRPLAAGTVPIFPAIMVALLLAFCALAAGLVIGTSFFVVLAAYLIFTTAYSFFLKRKMMIDIIVLALLYTIRVIGGAEAISVEISEWLLAFSMFIFTSLALIKRYIELATRIDAGLPELSNRNYRKGDLDIVAMLAAAAGFNAVTVFALFVSSDTVRQTYRHPQGLWLVCPLLMYWIGRALMMAHRRLMHHDPIIFALKDWNSLATFGLIGLIMLLSF
ncbi:UbiA family prenyltransferase [uncultured Rhodoblastus sp.]|uniref:UbiA family prenyltransferase n=1 Tax=uncultured Rhodoblastus sp. TaxID=543037 RepID=UPI0025E9E85E|nr:UbiA family prenyltransferase [uncultured Rhodoblastus sp.]